MLIIGCKNKRSVNPKNSNKAIPLRVRNAGLTPIDDLPPDHNVYCKRNNGETYVVLTPTEWSRLRNQGKLDSYLRSRRE